MNNQRSFIRFLLIYAVVLVVGQLFLGKYLPQRQPPTPAQTGQRMQTEREHALKAEQEARTSDTRLSISERSQKWEDAIRAYQEVARLAGNSDTAIDARVQEARLHEARASTDAKDISDYDQAQQIYKDLERQYPRRTATVTLDGHPTPVVVGDYARQKIETVLAARDQRQRHHVLYQILDFFVGLTGRIPGVSYWFALVLITGILKAVLHPFTKRQFKSMADMQRIAPKMKEMQEKLKGRPADEINRKIMALYKEEGVNPAAGCVPMIAQMAVLIPLYTMIRMYEYQFRHGYFLWIGSALSHQYPQFIATSLAVPDVPLLLLYLVSMFLTSRLQPAAADPQQAQQQKLMAYMMPVVFGWMTWKYAWPSAFTFYWLVLNVTSTWQQWRILKTVGAPVPPNPPQTSSGDGRGGSSNGSGPDGHRPVKPQGSHPLKSSNEPRRSGAKKPGRR